MLKKYILALKAVFDMLLLAISPMVLMLLIVAVIMLPDNYGAHRRLREALEKTPQTAIATITNCHEEDRYCFADCIDINGQEYYCKLDWRYYPEEIRAGLARLEQGDKVTVRFAPQAHDNEVVLAEYYEVFTEYKGYLYDLGITGLVCWGILILNPEILFFSLVDNLKQVVDAKWKRIIRPLQKLKPQ